MGWTSETRPAAAARIGVPLGTAMSMPGWQASQARRSQNGEVTGPRTGQVSGRPAPSAGGYRRLRCHARARARTSAA